MKMKFKNLNRKWKEYALAGCVCVLFYVCLTHLGDIFTAVGDVLTVFTPVFLGFIIAYIVNPLAVFIDNRIMIRLIHERKKNDTGKNEDPADVNSDIKKYIKKANLKKTNPKKLRWTVSVVISLLLVWALIGVLLASLIPQMIDNIVSVIDNVDKYIAGLEKISSNLTGYLKYAADNIIDYIEGNERVLTKIGTMITDNMKAIIATTSSFGSTAVNWLIGLILAVYFLLAKESISKALSKLLALILRSGSYERTSKLLAKFNAIFTKYIICELIDSIIIGLLNYVFMLICGMPSAVIISVVVGLTNLVPTFGPVVGAGIGGFILLLVDPKSVIPFLIFTLIVQSADSYLIKPKLFGNALNVPGFLILAAIIVFGRFMGVVGMLIAIPVAAIIVYIYKEMFIPYLEARKKVLDMKADID